jgi:hypothetical protein
MIPDPLSRLIRSTAHGPSKLEKISWKEEKKKMQKKKRERFAKVKKRG